MNPQEMSTFGVKIWHIPKFKRRSKLGLEGRRPLRRLVSPKSQISLRAFDGQGIYCSKCMHATINPLQHLPHLCKSPKLEAINLIIIVKFLNTTHLGDLHKSVKCYNGFALALDTYLTTCSIFTLIPPHWVSICSSIIFLFSTLYFEIVK